MLSRKKRKKNFSQGSRRRKILPAVFLLFSVLLMILPLESSVSSIKSLISYLFIPQIRASHASVEYAENVYQTVQELLNTHHENQQLKEEIALLRLENAQAREVFDENIRLTEALKVKAPQKWKGIWAKTAYREPTQWNSVIIDKGTADGVSERAAAIALQKGNVILAGVVVEVAENTAKVLLLQDEDFSAAVYAEDCREEGLIQGEGSDLLSIKYLPLLSKIKEGEKIYTSPSSSVFPSGILVGEVEKVAQERNTGSAVSVYVKPEGDSSSIRELFVLSKMEKN